MSTQTTDVHIKSASKNHACSWCGTCIESGTPYIRYRFFDCGDAGTVKMHPECMKASRKLIELEGGGTIYFMPGDSARGHYCGGNTDCNCLEHTKAGTDEN